MDSLPTNEGRTSWRVDEKGSAQNPQLQRFGSSAVRALEDAEQLEDTLSCERALRFTSPCSRIVAVLIISPFRKERAIPAPVLLDTPFTEHTFSDIPHLSLRKIYPS